MINSQPWHPFLGKADEIEYDIRLRTGDIVENCWFHRGKFSEQIGVGRVFDGSQVTELRVSSPTSEELTDGY